MIAKDIRTFLRNSDRVRDLVGTRIYGGNAPRGVNDNYVLLRSISSEHFYSLDNEIELRETVLQVDCYHETQTLADSVAEAIRNRLSGFRGVAGDSQVQAVRIIRDSDLEVPPADASDRWIYLRSMDYAIVHDTPIPSHYQ